MAEFLIALNGIQDQGHGCLAADDLFWPLQDMGPNCRKAPTRYIGQQAILGRSAGVLNN
jgi:hypothetical protein